MLYEKKPIKLIPKHYIPPYSRPYKVKDGDSFITLASQHRMEVWELIFENFKTRNPAEVNWYLRNYIGCTTKTRDGKNWMFGFDANPGIIHVPKHVIEMPPLTIYGKVPSTLRKVWAGLAKSHSGDLFFVGAHDLTGKIYCLGDQLPDVRNAVININGYKLGVGLGASISAVFVIAHGYDDVYQMKGVTGSWDLDVSIGAKLSNILKGINGLGKVVDTIQKYKKMRYITENAIKNIGITKPGIYTIPIPLAGIGLHLWSGYKFGDVSLFSTSKGIP